MDRAQIKLVVVDDSERRRLAEINGYEDEKTVPALAIVRAPEYGSWPEFFVAVMPDVRPPKGDVLTLLWVPNFESLSNGYSSFRHSLDNEDYYRFLAETAEQYGALVMDYTPRRFLDENLRLHEGFRDTIKDYHDRITFKQDPNGIYCARALVSRENLWKYDFDMKQKEAFPQPMKKVVAYHIDR